MTNIEKLALLRNRINKIEQSGKCIKSPGLLNSLKREARNLEVSIKGEN